MNTIDILRNGHQTVLNTVRDLPEADWETPGVCGDWSVKEILAHLASFELVLVDVLSSFLYDGATPTLDRFITNMGAFNDAEVARRRAWPAAKILAEYEQAYAQATRLLTRIPVEMRWQNGTLPWYGDQYDLDDFIVYTFYGHKQEHCAQIAVFRDRLARRTESLPPGDSAATVR